MSTIAERVARGVVFLDQVRPGWRDAISVDRIYLGSDTLCILGQAFADDLAEAKTGFHRACQVRYHSGCPYDICEMGFNGTPLGEHPTVEREALEAEWRRVIHAPQPAEVLA